MNRRTGRRPTGWAASAGDHCYLYFTMRRATRHTHAARALTAVITVWCLGCRAFDPLIAALVPGPGGEKMVCAADARAGSIVATARVADSSPSVSEITDQNTQTGDSCGCDSCYAPAATAVALVLPAPAIPHQPSADPVAPPSVDRPPLVPPPQRSA